MDELDVGVGWNSLLEDSTTLIPPSRTGVKIDRSLSEIEHAAARLAAKGSHGQQTQAEAATYFASRGFDLNKHSRSIKSFLQAGPVQSKDLAVVQELDVNSYLEKHHQQSIAETIRDSQFNFERNFREQYEEELHREWDETKKEIIDRLGAMSNSFSGTPAILQSSSISIPSVYTNTGPRQSLDDETRRYAEATKQFVQAVKSNSNMFHPVSKYENVQKTIYSFTVPEDSTKKAFCNVWETLNFLVGERRLQVNGKIVKGEPQNSANFRRMYEKRDPRLTEVLIERAKQHLEAQYAKYIQRRVHEFSENRGGQFGITYDIQNYVYLTFKDSIPSDFETARFADYDLLPLWAVVFYCLRCGNLTGALESMRRGDPKTCSTMCDALETLLNSKQQQNLTTPQLPTQMWQQLTSEYNRTVKPPHCRDPFKVAVYCIVAKCDPKPEGIDMSHVNSTIEDFLWIRLNMVWEKQEPPPSFSPFSHSKDKTELFSKLELKDLHDIIDNHKNIFTQEEQTQPYFYTNILLHTQQFEDCVKWLEQDLVKAVHLALVLNHYGFLATRPMQNKPYINLRQLVSKLVHRIAKVDCDLAFHYLYLLRLPDADGVFDDLMIDNLSLTSRDCSGVIGVVTARQVILNGSMVRFFSQDHVIRITLQAAKKAETEGNYKHATTLYQLSGYFDDLGKMLIRLVGQVIDKKKGNENRKAEYMNLAGDFFHTHHYHIGSHPRDRNVQRISPNTHTDLRISIQIANAFDCYHRGAPHFNEALSILDQLNLFPPRNEDESGSGVQHSSRILKLEKQRLEFLLSRGDSIKSNFNQVFEMMIKIYLFKINVIKQHIHDNPNDIEYKRSQQRLQRQGQQLFQYWVRTGLSLERTIKDKMKEFSQSSNLSY